MRFVRPPDFVIGGKESPYMLRWYLIPRNRWFNVYLHKILRDDDDRALHDHVAANISIVLRGSYDEIAPDVKAAATPHMRIADMPLVTKRRRVGSVVFRRASDAHRLEVVSGPVWTLWIKGPNVRDWFFHCKQGPVLWSDFVSSSDIGATGKGCDQ